MLSASNSTLILELRKKAVATLHESGDLFERAFTLLKEGDLEQAEHMQELARAKLTEAAWLLYEASRLELEASRKSGCQVRPKRGQL